MSEGQRIGVLGGTFDPVHNTHLDMARAALEAADLDKVLFVVAALPPHKRDETVASPETRYEMVNAAIANEPLFQASDVELRREGPSYTDDTLRELERQFPDADFFLIIGLDSLFDFPRWKDPDGILRRARLLVAPREADGRQIPESLTGKYEFLPFEESAVSSTEVRERIARRQSIDELVPAPVAELIARKGIYDA